MDLKLKGKRALVTGSSSGLGKAIAKMLAHEGAAVVIHGRDEARPSAVAREIRDQAGGTSVVLGGSVAPLLGAVAAKFKWGLAWEDIEKGAVRAMVPNDIGRLGRPDEIAGTVSYLCSPFADYISGAIIRVDGGTIRSL